MQKLNNQKSKTRPGKVSYENENAKLSLDFISGRCT